jgi:pimeloyl-ACP methyl ester carboxylesterase
MTRRDAFTTVDGFEIHYSEWGEPSDPTVLCVHGLSRVGRDFDPLAAALAADYHLVCPDMPGRGLSEWADDPAEWYTNEAMLELLVALVDRLDVESLRYVGTSMGGGLGIALAGGPLANVISHLVVNDVSPDPAAGADQEAIDRIAEYVPNPPTVETLTELEAYLKELYEGRFSQMTEQEWRRLTLTAARRTDDGGFTPGYDPRIAVGLEDDEATGDETDPWDLWAGLDSEILILRGVDSGILPTAPYERMLELQPEAATVEVDCGHAPSLNTDEQIEPIRDFFGS